MAGEGGQEVFPPPELNCLWHLAWIPLTIGHSRDAADGNNPYLSKDPLMKTFEQVSIVFALCLTMLSITGCDMTPVASRSEDVAGAPAEQDDSLRAGEQTPASAAGANAPLANSSAANSSSEIATTPSDNASAQKAPPEIPGADLVAALNNQQATAAFQRIQQTLTGDPNNLEARLQLMDMLQRVGVELMKSDKQKAYDAFAVADGIASGSSTLPEGFSSQLGNVFYNQACVLAIRGNATEALNVLDKAIQWGFQDLELLKSDSDLSSVRALPEFAGKIESWGTKIAEVARKQAEEILAHGETFPFDFAVTDIQGTLHKLSDYSGKVVIVDIWGTWCPPCRAEIPSFVELQKKYGSEGLQIVGLNYERVSGDEGLKLVKDFVNEFGINYPCAIGDPATQSQVPNFEGYPTTLFIDKTGKVRLKVVGAHPYAYLESIVTALLAEPAAEGTSAAGG
jgi:thiol-disulfide isomerase/thioredoxin